MIPTTVISQLRCTGAQCLCAYSFSSQNAQSPEAPMPLQMTIKRLPLSWCLLVLGLCHTSRTSAKNNSVILQMTSRKWPHTPHFPTHIVSMGTLGKKILLREFAGTHFRPGGPGLHCTVLEVWFPGVAGIHLRPIVPYELLPREGTNTERCWRLAGTKCPDASSTLTSNYWRQKPQSSRCHVI